MVLILYGSEQYKIDCYRAKFEKEVPDANKAFDLSRFDGGFDEEVLESLYMPPLLSEKRVVILNAPDLKAVDTKHLKKYLEKPSKTTDLLIVLDKKPDGRMKSAKEFLKQGIMKPCEKLTSQVELENLLLLECQKAGGKMTEKGMNELVERLSYFEVEEMNLLKAISYLNNCIDYGGGVVTPEAVKAMVPESVKKDIFGTALLLKNGDINALMKQAKITPPEEAIGAASVLLRDFRISYKRKMFSISEIGAYKEPVFKNEDEETVLSCISVITDEIRGVKEGVVEPEALLQEVFNRTFALLNPVSSGT